MRMGELVGTTLVRLEILYFTSYIRFVVFSPGDKTRSMTADISLIVFYIYITRDRTVPLYHRE